MADQVTSQRQHRGFKVNNRGALSHHVSEMALLQRMFASTYNICQLDTISGMTDRRSSRSSMEAAVDLAMSSSSTPGRIGTLPWCTRPNGGTCRSHQNILLSTCLVITDSIICCIHRKHIAISDRASSQRPQITNIDTHEDLLLK
jgi:hypothetical protein